MKKIILTFILFVSTSSFAQSPQVLVNEEKVQCTLSQEPFNAEGSSVVIEKEAENDFFSRYLVKSHEISLSLTVHKNPDTKNKNLYGVDLIWRDGIKGTTGASHVKIGTGASVDLSIERGMSRLSESPTSDPGAAFLYVSCKVK